jgi:hypothetical protein
MLVAELVEARELALEVMWEVLELELEVELVEARELV